MTVGLQSYELQSLQHAGGGPRPMYGREEHHVPTIVSASSCRARQQQLQHGSRRALRK